MQIRRDLANEQKEKKKKEKKIIEQRQIYMEENKKLMESLNKLNQSQISEVNKLKSDLEKYKTENEHLNSDLLKANKIISGISFSQVDNNELKTLREENAYLKHQLTLKEDEIKDLKNKLQNNSIEEQSFKYKDIMVLILYLLTQLFIME